MTANDTPCPSPDRIDGEDFSAALLFQEYAHCLVALADRRLDARLAGKVDAEDVVQSVFRTLWRRLNAGLLNPAGKELWRMLVCITLRKCHREADHYFAACRDVRREGGAACDAASAPTPEPTPEEAAILLETLEGLRGGLNSERKRQILDLTLQGYAVADISESVSYYERGVERIRAEIRRRLTEMLQ